MYWKGVSTGPTGLQEGSVGESEGCDGTQREQDEPPAKSKVTPELGFED